MSGHRKALRDAVRTALAADVRISAFDRIDAWVRPTDRDRLPVYAVYVPRDPSTVSSQDTIERRTVVEVLIKRIQETNVEDDIDLDVEAIEAAVLPALLSVSSVLHADIDGPEFSFSGEGATTVYQARIPFSVQLFHAIPTAG